MAYAPAVLPLDGTETDYDVPFLYINQDHVIATVDGSTVPFSWLTTQRIRLDSAGVNGQTLRIYRDTPIADAVVTFQPTQTPFSTSLNLAHDQLLFRQQELEYENDNDLIDAVNSAIGDYGVITDGASAARTLPDRFADRVNVKDYGVIGDGLTDDTAAILAVANAVAPAVLWFPRGVYIISDHDEDSIGLELPSGIKLEGDGEGSILRLDSATTDIDVVVTWEAFAEDFGFSNIQIDGNRANITPEVDLYNHFALVRGPRGGQRGAFRDSTLSNSWGRVLQTGNESFSEYSTDIVVDKVRVTNAGTKAISATKSKRVTISNCFAEVDPYTSSDHPGGVGDGNAASGSCFECNHSTDVVLKGNHGVHIGASVVGPGLRFVNENASIKAFGNTIDGASYLGFIQNVNDISFFGNTGRNIRGSAILIADADGESGTCRRVRVYENTVIDPSGAYVLIKADNSGHNPEVECFVYNNEFVQIAGTPTHGIYNFGVVSPAVGGECRVYEWGNRFTGTVPNQRAGAGAAEIEGEPGHGLELIAQSAVASSTHTGTTAETTIQTVTIKANKIGKNGYILVEPHWTFTGSGGNRITRERFGGSQAAAVTNASSILQHSKLLKIRNRNSLTAQLVSVSGLAAGIGATTSATATMTKDTSGDLNITFTVELANAADTAVLDGYFVWVYHSR